MDALGLRPYPTLAALREGEVVDIEGLKFAMAVDEDGNEQEIHEGDLYIAERNTGPKLLTAKEVVVDTGPPYHFGGWIKAKEQYYSYDINECVKVVWIEE